MKYLMMQGRSKRLRVLLLQSILLMPVAHAVTMKGQPFRYEKTKHDAVAEHRQLRIQEADNNAVHVRPYQPITSLPLPKIPVPHAMPSLTKTISLHEAIALALRNNVDVKVAELNRIVDKFGLEVSIWSKYEPQITALQVTNSMQKNGPPTWNLSTGVSVYSPTGTTATIDYANNLYGGIGTTTLTVEQKLLQGFSLAVNRIDYENAIDNELVARLSYKDTIMGVVDSVTTAYRTLVSDYNSLKTQKQSLKSQEDEVYESKLRVKAGKMSESDLLQQQQNLEGTRLDVVNQQETLRNDYQAFLQQLGLVSSTHLSIEKNITIKGVHVPSRQDAIRIALAHNIDYQTSLINLRTTERALLSAKDARKWTLDMTGSVQLGNQAQSPNGPVVSQNTNPTLGFSLSIPINDLTLKQGVVAAKVALESAKMQLAQKKQDLIRDVINQLDSIENQREQIKIAELELKLQQKTLQNGKLKLKYGKTTVFEVNSLINQLVSQEVALIGLKISYLNAVTSLDNKLGITLDKWSIKLRY